MFSQPTFEGFRLSLSEKSRLIYSQIKPESWSEKIESVKYKNEFLDIDVQFSSGLNVVIGGSSSGKTLLVDSIWRKLSKKSFEDSNYKDFDVENINVVNPSEMTPHYLGQNYIMKVIGNDSEQGIALIDDGNKIGMASTDYLYQLAQKKVGRYGRIVFLDNTIETHQGKCSVIGVVGDEFSLACKTHAINAMRLEDVDGEVRTDANNHQWQQ